MKIQNLLLTLALCATVLVQFTAPAATLENLNGYNAFGGSGTTQGTTNAYYVAGNYTLNAGTPVVRYLNVSSDLAASKAQFYVLTNEVTIGTVVLGTTNFTVTSTNNFTATDILVIKHTLSDTYERLPLLTVALTNQLTTKWVPIIAPASGDKVWLARPAGFMNIGAATNVVPISGGSFYAGQYGKPLLIEINGTSWAQINAVSGDYR